MRKLRCMFIEDSQTDAEIIEWELRKKGILLEYVIVETESELILALLDNDFNLILSDHNMPCLDSVTALIKCRELAPRVPFIVLSFYIPADVLKCLKNNNVNAILDKNDISALYKFIQQIEEK